MKEKGWKYVLLGSVYASYRQYSEKAALPPAGLWWNEFPLARAWWIRESNRWPSSWFTEKCVWRVSPVPSLRPFSMSWPRHNTSSLLCVCMGTPQKGGPWVQLTHGWVCGEKTDLCCEAGRMGVLGAAVSSHRETQGWGWRHQPQGRLSQASVLK